MLVGVRPGSGRAGPDTLRRAAAAFVRAAGESGTAVFVLPAPLAARPRPTATSRGPCGAAQAVTEGAVLGAYRFVAHKSDPKAARIERLVVAGVGTGTGTRPPRTPAWPRGCGAA